MTNDEKVAMDKLKLGDLKSRIKAASINSARGIRGFLPLAEIRYSCDFHDIVKFFKRLFTKKEKK